MRRSNLALITISLFLWHSGSRAILSAPERLTGYDGNLIKLVPYPNDQVCVLVDSKGFILSDSGVVRDLGLAIAGTVNVNKSSVLRRLSNGYFAMGCGDKHITVFDESNNRIAERTVSMYPFSPNTLCSLVEYDKDKLIFSYVSSMDYVVELIKFDSITKTLSLVKEWRGSFKYGPMLCNVFKINNYIICILDRYSLKYFFFEPNFAAIQYEAVAPRTKCIDIQMLWITENSLIVFLALSYSVYGNVLTMDPTRKIISVLGEEELIMEATTIGFISVSVKTIGNVFVVALNNPTYLFIQKVYSTLEKNGPLIKIPINGAPISALIASHTSEVIQTTLNVVITTSTISNWRIKIKFPLCNSTEYPLSKNIKWPLTDLGEAGVSNLRIIFISKNPPNPPEVTPIELDSPQLLDEVELAFTEGGVYAYRFIILEDTNEISSSASVSLHSEDCTLTLNVCFRLCDICSAVGTDLDHKCDSCIDRYFLNPAKPSDCIFNCYSTCKTCTAPGDEENHQCSSCKNGYQSDPIKPSICVEIPSCSLYYYVTVNQIKVCILNDKCPPLYPYLLDGTSQCISQCDSLWELSPTNICKCLSPNMINKLNKACVVAQQFIDEMNDKINNQLDNNILDLLRYYPIWNQNNSTLAVYPNTPEGRLSVSGPNLSSIDIDECEAQLRQANTIPESESLIIAKTDHRKSDQLTHDIFFQVYRENGIKLNTSICKKALQFISTPILDSGDVHFDLINRYAAGDIDLFSQVDSFFQDICTIDSISSKDMTLEDRRKTLYQIHSSLFCKEGCKAIKVDQTSNRVICRCQETYLEQDQWEPLALTSVIPYSNVEVAKCYLLVFQSSNFYLNAGFIINLLLLIITLILFIRTCCLRVSSSKIISKIQSNAMQYAAKEPQSNGKQIPKNRKASIAGLRPTNHIDNRRPSISGLRPNNYIDNRKPSFSGVMPMNFDNRRQSIPGLMLNFNSRKLSNSGMKPINNNDRRQSISGLKPTICEIKTPSISTENSQCISIRKNSCKNTDRPLIVSTPMTINLQNTQTLSDEELSKLSYEQAIQSDKRNLFGVFCSYFNAYSIIFHTISSKSKEEKAKIVRVSLLLFCFASDLFFSVLLYTDNYISYDYYSDHSFNFGYHLPRAIFACLASFCLKRIMTNLSSFTLDRSNLTENNTQNTILAQAKLQLRYYSIKTTIFFVTQFVLFGVFWYYSSAFCSVYHRSQWKWIAIALMTIVFNQIIAIVCAILTSTFRLLSLTWKSQTTYDVCQKFQVLNE